VDPLRLAVNVGRVLPLTVGKLTERKLGELNRDKFTGATSVTVRVDSDIPMHQLTTNSSEKQV
jgi:hypothetical protein